LKQFEAADRNPALIEDGALNFVVVGAGPTGVETAGALSDLFYNLLPDDYHQLATDKARIMIVEMGKRFSRHSRRIYESMRKRSLKSEVSNCVPPRRVCAFDLFA
jgi:NADH dehydrogenase FAD-containing subunit